MFNLAVESNTRPNSQQTQIVLLKSNSETDIPYLTVSHYPFESSLTPPPPPSTHISYSLIEFNLYPVVIL